MPVSHSIVIAGAGPTGLTLASLLKLRGFDPIVLERSDGTVKLPQAHVISARTLEILRELDIADRCVREAGRSRLLGPVRWAESITGRPYGCLAFEDTSVRPRLSHYEPINLAQSRLEPILLERFIGLGGRVRFGQEVVGFEQDGGGVTVQVQSREEGLRSIRCDWLVGCDGAGSTVRRASGIAMEGPTSLMRFMTIYFRASLDPFVAGKPGPLFWIGGCEVRGIVISFDEDTNYALLVPIGDTPVEAFDDEAACAIVRKAIGKADVPIDVTGRSSWNMSAQVADRFRHGRVLLAGDACHRFPPTGGLGLNSGVQDAQNLAWKLAAVLRGQSDEALLDTYEQERRPIAQANTRQSVSNLMTMRSIDDALGKPILAPVAPDAARGPIAAYAAEQLGIDDGLPGAADRRAAVQLAIEAQKGHFGDSAGVHFGFAYDEGALVPDGSPRPSLAAHHFDPDAHPGARLPWFEWTDEQGRAQPSLDLIDPGRATLLTFDRTWTQAAPAEVMVRVLGPADRGADAVLRIGETGAVLIRPDGHVGWRTRTHGGTELNGLRTAVNAIFHPRVRAAA